MHNESCNSGEQYDGTLKAILKSLKSQLTQ